MQQPKTVVPSVEISLSAHTSTADDAPPPYLEPTPAAEFMVDGLAGVQISGGILRLAFFSERQVFPEGTGNARIITARLALTPQSVVFVSEALKRVIDQMVTDGVMVLPEVILK